MNDQRFISALIDLLATTALSRVQSSSTELIGGLRRAAHRAATCSTVPDAQPGTHRGHINLFLTALGTPSSASVFLWFLRVTFSHPAFTAETRGGVYAFLSGDPLHDGAGLQNSCLEGFEV